MEASALQVSPALPHGRGCLSGPLLRLRSDEQLVALFRAGNEEAFCVIHDRYRKRLFAYTRQMLPASRQDAEEAVQDVFIKAYAGLRADERELALRAWLYRVAHNRCIDEMRRPVPPVPLAAEAAETRVFDPVAVAEQRETLRRLVEDLQRLPEQQRSALLMRELSGMTYAELSAALGLSVAAVKSLLVRARISLAAELEARETECLTIREELVLCHDRGARPMGTARRHLRRCAECRDFRRSMRGVSRSFAAITPALGPVGLLVKLLGGGGAAAGSGGVVGTGGAVSTSGAVGTGGAVTAGGALATGGMLSGGGALAGGFAATAGHVATLLAAAVVTAGGAVAIQPTLNPPRSARGHSLTHARPPGTTAGGTSAAASAAAGSGAATMVTPAGLASSPGASGAPAYGASAEPGFEAVARAKPGTATRSSRQSRGAGRSARAATHTASGAPVSRTGTSAGPADGSASSGTTATPPGTITGTGTASGTTATSSGPTTAAGTPATGTSSGSDGSSSSTTTAGGTATAGGSSTSSASTGTV